MCGWLLGCHAACSPWVLLLWNADGSRRGERQLSKPRHKVVRSVVWACKLAAEGVFRCFLGSEHTKMWTWDCLLGCWSGLCGAACQVANQELCGAVRQMLVLVGLHAALLFQNWVW